MDRESDILLGRYQALRVYSAIGRLPKPTFTTGELASITDVPTSALSKELARLAKLGVIKSVSRRGDYERMEADDFWQAIELLAVWAESA